MKAGRSSGLFGSRRAVEYYLVLLILLLAVLGVFLVFQAALFRESKAVFSRDECAASVRANAYLRLDDTSFSREIRCAVNPVTLPASELAVPRIADVMAECWSVFGEGKLNLFSGDGKFCVPCAVVSFSETDITVPGLSSYLAHNKVPARFGRGSYLEYLSGYATQGVGEYYDVLELRDKAVVAPVLDTSKDYGVMFVSARGLDEISQVKSWAGTTETSVGAGLAAGAVVGTAAVVIFGGPVTWVGYGAYAAAIGVSALAGGVYTFLAGEEPVWMSFVTLMPWEEQEFKKLGCTYLPADKILA